MHAISGNAIRNKTSTADGATGTPTLFSLLPAIGGALLCVLATRVHAQDVEMAPKPLEVRVDLLGAPPNETGFTLGDLLDTKMWNLITHPLRLGTLNQIGASTHQVPRAGVQLELLTPAAGVTLHFRW